MKILFVNNFRGRGGGEEFLRDLLPGLARKGVTVGLVCRPGTPLEEIFQDTAVQLYPIPRNGVGMLTSVFTIAKIIRKQDYQIINIQRGHDIIQAWIAALLTGKNPKLIYTPQVPEFKRSRFLLGRMDHIVTISRYIRDAIASFHRRILSKITIIHYGIDHTKFKPENTKTGFLRSKFKLSSDTKIIGTVGDLWKNQIEFLDSLVESRKQFPDARYALVAAESGIGQVAVFKRRVAELGLDDAVLWSGRLSKDEMLAFYADIDIAVSTHRNEGFGIWILEALAMGKPVVAFNAGGIRDSLEGCPAGVLVNGSAGEMAGEIIRILKDDGARKKMSEAGPGWIAEKFSRERMIVDYCEFFEKLTSSGKR